MYAAFIAYALLLGVVLGFWVVVVEIVPTRRSRRARARAVAVAESAFWLALVDVIEQARMEIDTERDLLLWDEEMES